MHLRLKFSNWTQNFFTNKKWVLKNTEFHADFKLVDMDFKQFSEKNYMQKTSKNL